MQQIEIRLSGSGGQGILLASHILADALSMEGWKIAQSQSYEPTSRGGLSRSDLVAGEITADYPLASALNYLVILDPVAIHASDAVLQQSSVILIDESAGDGLDSSRQGQARILPLLETARALNDIRSANMVALGALVALARVCRPETLDEAIRSGAPSKLVPSMIDAVHAGQALIQAVA